MGEDRERKALSTTADLGLTTDEAASPATFDIGQRGPEAEPSRHEDARYVVVRELARGGLGRILVAHDRVLDRPVAVKELLRPAGMARARFARETRITARLEHPSIVPVHDAGTWPTGEPFYTMKLVSGQTLDAAIAERKTLVERLGLVGTVIAVCEAMAYAHSQRVVHRDLKPQNVLVGEFGETVVVDWGLAKVIGTDEDESIEAVSTNSADSGLTRVGAVVGTPAYMPPEQARGEPIDERADVYALGAILYHTLAGKRPYHGLEGTLKHLAAGPPVPLEALVPAVPRDLLAIVGKAMARDPADRYPSARELAADLERFRTGQIVGAYHYGTRELIARWVRRHRAVAGMLVLLAVTIAVSFAVVVRWQRIAEAARERERVRADEIALQQASLAVDRDPHGALELLANLSDDFPHHAAVRTLAADALARGLPQRWSDHEAAVDRLAVSPDGSLLASGGHDQRVVLRDARTGATRHVIELPKAVGAIDWSPDGRAVVVAAGNDVSAWDPVSGERSAHMPHPDYVQSLDISPDGRLVLTTSIDRVARLWDLATGEPAGAFPAHDEWLMHGSFSPDGAMAATTSSDGVTVLWDVATRTERRRWRSQRSTYRNAFSPDGRSLAVIAVARAAEIHDVATGETRPFEGHTEWISAIAWLPDGRLATASNDRTIRVWTADGEPQAVLVGHDDVVASIALSADGRRLASAGADGVTWLWDLGTAGGRRLVGHRAAATAVALGPDGRVFASDIEGDVLAWDPDAGARVVGEGITGLRDAALSPDGRKYAAVTRDGLWLADAATGEGRMLDADARMYQAEFAPDGRSVSAIGYCGELHQWALPSGEVLRVAPASSDATKLRVAPDGRMITIGDDGIVRLWDEAGDRVLLDADKGLWGAAWSQDGRWLAVGGEDHVTWLWDTLTDAPPKVLAGHSTAVSHVAFAGERLVTATGAGEVFVWEDLAGTPTWRALGGHRSETPALATSADGRFVAVGDGLGVITLWDLHDADRMRVLTGHSQYLKDLRFSPDSRTLGSTAWDETARLWDLSDPLPDEPPSRALVGHGAYVTAIRFPPDGGWVLTASGDGTIRRWPDDLPRDPDALRARIDELATPR